MITITKEIAEYLCKISTDKEFVSEICKAAYPNHLDELLAYLKKNPYLVRSEIFDYMIKITGGDFQHKFCDLRKARITFKKDPSEENFNALFECLYNSELYIVGGGPFSITAVVADMLIDEDGEKKYLTCCWVSEAPEDLSFEVSTKELYPFYLDMDYEDDELTVDDAKASVTETYLSAEGEYTGKYKNSYRVLEKLVMDKVKEEDLLWDDEDDEEDEEE